ncbi:hypothetical protein [Oryzifoliimicrobium ureilyticus]|uniref:hypothetical protein n=1 Tax=Oryzifoliimicrobium ureilyticus TaxID=3113724 RepID=UPI0030766617
MTWRQLDVETWQERVSAESKGMANRQIAGILERFSLVPSGFPEGEISAAVHEGPLAVSGDFTPPTQLCAVLGDLTVTGKLSTEAVDGADGNATLIVFGDLDCASLVNDWASILVIAGDCRAYDWCFAAREDSAFIIGGDFTTPIFLGADIWASVGGLANMDYGYGYASSLASFSDTYDGKHTLPRKGPRELALKLGLGRQAALDEAELIEAIEQRLYATGSIMPLH